MTSDLYDLRFEDRSDYLYAHVKAELITLEIAVQYINRTVARLRESMHNRMLFVRETPMLTTESHYSIISSVILNILPVDARVALVDQSPAHDVVAKVINSEAAEKKRTVRAFAHLPEAVSWLLSDTHHPFANTSLKDPSSSEGVY